MTDASHPDQHPNPYDTATMPKVVSLSVLAVLVVRNPETDLEETLLSLAAQDYPNIAVSVALPLISKEYGEQDDRLSKQVKDILPDAHISRLSPEAATVGTFFNEAVLSTPESTKQTLFLFLREDVVLAEDAVRRLVLDLEKVNAGVIAPKLLDRDDPRKLLHIGYKMDKTGGRIPIATPSEYDQGQHDHTEKVFAVSSACLMVRSDLFLATGLFSSEVAPSGEDIDLCWRSHLAHAQVVIEPRAVALVKTQTEDEDETHKAQVRHQLFSMLTCTGAGSLFVALPQTVITHVAQSAVATLFGHSKIMRNIASGWLWNFTRPRLILRTRRQIAQYRSVEDETIRRLQEPGFAELKQFMRSHSTQGGIGSSLRHLRDWAGRAGTRKALLIWLIFLAVLGFGSRHLFSRGIPQIGEFAAFPEEPGGFFSQWFSSLQGAGQDGFNSIALGVLGVISTVLFGAMGLTRTLVILGMIPLGVLGVARLLRGFGSRRVAWIGATVYLVLPLPYNAVSAGSWSVLVLYGLLPWLMSLLISEMSGDNSPSQLATRSQAATRSQIVRRVLGIGLLGALAVAFVPFAIVMLLGCVAALSVATLFVGQQTRQFALVGLAGTAAAFVFSLPMITGFLSWSALVGTDAGINTEDGRGVWELIRFATGPINESWLGWGLLLGASLPLLVVRGERFLWVVRGWALVCVSVGVAWLGERDWLRLPDADLLLVPAGVGFAIAAAMGMAALDSDLPSFRFGWRQLVPFAGVAALVVMVVPILGASLEGRWSTDRNDYATALQGLVSQDSEQDAGTTSPSQAHRVLWLGHPDVLGGVGRELTGDLGYTLTTGMSTQIADLWARQPDDGPLKDAVNFARGGTSDRLGRLLSPMGIRYVVTTESLAPPPASSVERPLPSWVEAVMSEQLDMRRVDLREGIVVYENCAAVPQALTVADNSLRDTEQFRDVSFAPLPNSFGNCEEEFPSSCDFERTVVACEVPLRSDLYLASSSGSWQAEVPAAGEGDAGAGDAGAGDASQLETLQVSSSKTFGWGQTFEVAETSAGGATSELKVSHKTAGGYVASTAIQLSVWLAVLLYLALFRDRRRRTGQLSTGQKEAQL